MIEGPCLSNESFNNLTLVVTLSMEPVGDLGEHTDLYGARLLFKFR